MDESNGRRSSKQDEEDAQHEFSESDSASCNSISNPYYDGPRREGLPSDTGIQTPEEQSCSRSTLIKQPIKNNEMVIITMNLSYFKTCIGFLRLLQLILTAVTLMCLTMSGLREGGLLNLPLDWHFRIMLFVLVLTFLTSLVILVANITSLINVFAVEWNFVNVPLWFVGFKEDMVRAMYYCPHLLKSTDMVLYSVFSFLYLVGTSLVASAFDFYQKMKTNVSEQTVQQLVVVVILGYICMVVYGLTALFSYLNWRVQYRLYQRRKLLEEDEIDL